jgi:hypothetical protein
VRTRSGAGSVRRSGAVVRHDRLGGEEEEQRGGGQATWAGVGRGGWAGLAWQLGPRRVSAHKQMRI